MALHPFDPEMADADLSRVLRQSPWRELIEADTPKAAEAQRKTLERLLRQHGQILERKRGEIVVRRGDYGHSAFFIVKGSVRVVLDADGLLPEEEGKVATRGLGRLPDLLRMFWRRPEVEARDSPGLTSADADANDYVPIILSDVGVVLDRSRTARIGAGEMFGEIGALCRMPRTASVFAEEDETELLQIRWQGLRPLRDKFPEFRERMDEVFRARSLRQHLRAGFGFSDLGDTTQIRQALAGDDVLQVLDGVLDAIDKDDSIELQMFEGRVMHRIAASRFSRAGEGTVAYVYENPVDHESARKRAPKIIQAIEQDQKARNIVLIQPLDDGRMWSWSSSEDERGDRRPLRQLFQPAGQVPERFIRELIRPLVLEEVVRQAEFHSHGAFEWSQKSEMANQPIIAKEGEHPNGLLFVRAGFARLSRNIEGQERTVSYLGPGRMFGLEEITHNYRNPTRRVRLRHTLRSLGYVDVVWLPTTVVERYVLPAQHGPAPDEEGTSDASGAVDALQAVRAQTGIDRGLLEYLVEERLTNGTAAMVIDLERCTRCDDCVRACASAHDNNPRFLRHGRVHGRYMIANACMHCADPVCMIGCPTGAISRNMEGGQVIINDRICIGCSTCAGGSNNAPGCPYDNIRMVEIRDETGRFFFKQKGKPYQKATKCDLCFHLPQGPACQNACPHDALGRIDLTAPESLRDWVKR